MADIFETLFEFQFRGLSAPCRSFKTSGGQDLTEHKRVDRDGGRQEGTGRNPYTFEVSLCFINGLAPAASESWSGDLFPGRFQQFLALLEDRSTGPVQHPIFGPVTCKPATWDFAVNFDDRGGVYLNVVFKQTDDTDTATALGALHAFTDAQIAAGDLDAQLGQLDPPPDPAWGNDDGTSFSDAVNGIASIGDQVSLFKSQAVGQVNGVVAKCDTIADAFSNTPATTSGANLTTNSLSVQVSAPTVDGGLGRTATGSDGVARPVGAAGARIVDAASRLRASLALVLASLLVADKAVGFYKTPQRTTLPSLAIRLGADVEDLLALNAGIAATPVIPRETTVRYYL